MAEQHGSTVSPTAGRSPALFLESGTIFVVPLAPVPRRQEEEAIIGAVDVGAAAAVATPRCR